MQQNLDAKKSQKVKEDFTAIWVMESFARSLRMEPRFLHYFGLLNLQLVEFINQFVEKHMHVHLSFPSIKHKILFLLPDSLQRWYSSTFIRKGFDTIIISRKIMIAAKINNAIENENVKQVIFLGAGYDPRAFLAATKYKAVNFFELDRGFNREHKIKALQNLPDHLVNAVTVSQYSDKGIVFNQNLTCIDCDFKKDNLVDLLSHHGYDLSLKTLVVGEGISLYLPKSAMDALMQSLYALLPENCEIIISFVGRREMSPKRLAKLRARITVDGEMAYFALKSHEVIAYSRYHGFEVKDKFTTASAMTLENNQKIKAYYADPTKRDTAYYTLVKSHQKSRYESIDEVPEIKLDWTDKFSK
jgi:methyltransferase (TIGR00027 family)